MPHDIDADTNWQAVDRLNIQWMIGVGQTAQSPTTEALMRRGALNALIWTVYHTHPEARERLSADLQAVAADIREKLDEDISGGDRPH